MRSCVEVFRACLWSRLIAVSLLGLGIAGCSADATRLDPLSNPYASRNNAPSGEVTGSIPNRTVESRPLPQTTAKLPPPPRPAVSSTGVARSAGPATVRLAKHAGWDWNGGTAVTVAQGETIYSIAHRYGVPASAIMQANHITDARSVQPGQHLVIPRYSATARASAPQPKPIITGSTAKTAARAPGGVHIVAPGETLMMLSRRYHVSLNALARANNIPRYTKLKIGDRVVIPGMHNRVPVAAKRPSPPPARQKMVAAESPHVARTVTPANIKPAVAKTAEATGSMPTFRWPVRGRIISAYGPKPSGQKNDGINLAVPEGTPIKAAENGLVVYVGNELKGYGNLVLVRHANGFVTAYANTSAITVKRGETVKRGQVIARAGQTGNVSSPQLHFEIRKGSQPVDPTKFLSGA